eukprot:191182-Chlamydomonas_euryale.AAC.1
MGVSPRPAKSVMGERFAGVRQTLGCSASSSLETMGGAVACGCGSSSSSGMRGGISSSSTVNNGLSKDVRRWLPRSPAD